MKRDGDLPSSESPGLSVRPGVDVHATADDDEVAPDGGGLSCVPDDPRLLAIHRRPESLGGTSKHPVWSLDRGSLPARRLTSRADSRTHETILPIESITLSDFQRRLRATAIDWKVSHE